MYEREAGLPKITTFRLPDVEEPLKSLQGGKSVEFIDPIYSVDPSESPYSSSILRFHYSSLRTPPSVYDYDMNTGISVLKKIEPVSYVKKVKKFYSNRKSEFFSFSSNEQIKNLELFISYLIFAPSVFVSSWHLLNCKAG